MKNLYLFAALALACAAAQAQTSFGNVVYPAPNSAGTGGGSGNSYFGHNAGDNNTADQNTFLGAYSGFGNTTGDSCAYVGSNSGRNNVLGHSNSFLGFQSGYNTNNSKNTFIGSLSGYQNTAGNRNTYIGSESGRYRVGGVNNVAIGYHSGQGSSGAPGTNLGSNNTFLGTESGFSNTGGSGNVFIGYQAGRNETTGNDKLFIDNSNTATPLIWGDFTNGSKKLNFNGNVGIGTPGPLEALHVTGNIRFSGALMPNGQAGSDGQLLTIGAGGALTWAGLTSNQIPNLDASKITAGTFNIDRVNTNFGSKDIYTTGNVGIGPISLSEKLNVNGNIKVADDADIFGLDILQGYNDLRFQATPTSGTNLYIGSNGNVGIGTTSSFEKLEINGNILIGHQQFLKGKRQDGNTSNLIGYNGNILAFSEYSGVPSEVRIYTPWDAGQGVSIYSNQLIAFFRNDGYVGIGTTSPSEKLHVNGNIRLADNGDIFGLGIIQGYNDLYFQPTPTSGTALYIDADRNVSIRSTDNHGEHFWVESGAGKPGGGFWGSGSDRRLKKDIAPFTDGLEQVKQIKPVWYRYNGVAGFPTEERYVGIIAQEMQEVAPYTISSFAHIDKDSISTDYLRYDGSAVLYMLVNAIKEQQQQIEAQQKELETLKSALYGSPTKNTSGKTSAEQTLPGGFALYQNVPNPFDRSTVIGAELPESVQQAKIVVYNLQGLELASYPLSERGKVSVEISGGRFPAGMYLYALLADGQVIDTKKMILTD